MAKAKKAETLPDGTLFVLVINRGVAGKVDVHLCQRDGPAYAACMSAVDCSTDRGENLAEWFARKGLAVFDQNLDPLLPLQADRSKIARAEKWYEV